MEDHLKTFERLEGLFEENLKHFTSYRDAYECAEDTHEKRYGYRRCSNYHSFRNLRRYWKKKKIKGNYG
jgi:hypothetical protein